MQLSQKTQNFVGRMGLFFERLGLTRTSGRILGVLLMAENPLSLNELAETLQASKASISTNARVVAQAGLIHRVSVPGDRRDFYETSPESLEAAVAQRMRTIESFLGLAAEGIAALDEGDNDAARRRLQTMTEFYRYFLDELDGALRRWREHRGA